MSEIGRLSMVLAFLASCCAVVSIAWGLRTSMAGPLRSGRRAVWTVCALTLLATVLLVSKLVANDFSWRYVAEHTSSDLPVMYRVSSLWAGQEGSLLLWLLILSAYACAFLWAYRKRLDPFYDAGRDGGGQRDGLLHGAPRSSPRRSACSRRRPRRQRAQPAPSRPGMMIHPPILYIGYVGSSRSRSASPSS